MAKKKRAGRKRVQYGTPIFPSIKQIKRGIKTAKQIKRAIRPPATERLRRTEAKVVELRSKFEGERLERAYKKGKARWKKAHPGRVSKAKAALMKRFARRKKSIY